MRNGYVSLPSLVKNAIRRFSLLADNEICYCWVYISKAIENASPSGPVIQRVREYVSSTFRCAGFISTRSTRFRRQAREYRTPQSSLEYCWGSFGYLGSFSFKRLWKKPLFYCGTYRYDKICLWMALEHLQLKFNSCYPFDRCTQEGSSFPVEVCWSAKGMYTAKHKTSIRFQHVAHAVHFIWSAADRILHICIPWQFGSFWSVQSYQKILVETVSTLFALI